VITSVSIKFRDDEIETINAIRKALLGSFNVTRHGLLKESIRRGLEAICKDMIVKESISQVDGFKL
jgi:hypothetical protein